MAVILFFKWWYGPGWANAFKSIFDRSKKIEKELSLPILVKTLFEPWKQITTYTPKDSSLDIIFHNAMDNLFARAFGFVIRFFTIIFTLAAMGVLILFGALLAVAWPAVPFLPLLFIVLGVI